MTLAFKTADILHLAAQALTHLMSGQHALHSPDDSKSALQQLAVTVQAAAKLAELAHPEVLTALGGVPAVWSDHEVLMERIRAEREMVGMKAEAEKVGSEVQEKEGINAETKKCRMEGEEGIREAEKLDAPAGEVWRKTERAMAEADAEKVGKETLQAAQVTERTRVEVVKVVREREKIMAERERVGKEVEWSVAETGRLNAEAGKVARETERARAEMERFKAETERLKAETMVARSQKLRIDAETERAKAELERTKVETAGDDEKAGKEAEGATAETERLKAEAMMARSEEMKLDAETERVKAETERTRGEEGQKSLEAESELKKLGMERSVQETERPEPGNNTGGPQAAGAVRKEVDKSVPVQEVEESKIVDYLDQVEADIARKQNELKVHRANFDTTNVKRLTAEIASLTLEARRERSWRRMWGTSWSVLKT
ncbi:uncharacterized protein LAJ45_10290 [Morchella importuna]|uniref:uncharacterized protein n=1 Tax=Morchella importuna TaxID=1174673 RepID=UPI001E8DCC33|nr:uncharacterized protein LAJ45_10290 [Morchella importuna]KAH8145650.1 hypothetical protein LAJ45_10290 [Morchella importuna]